MAQRQRRDGRDSFSIMAHFWQNAAVASSAAAVSWMPVLAALEPYW